MKSFTLTSVVGWLCLRVLCLVPMLLLLLLLLWLLLLSLRLPLLLVVVAVLGDHPHDHHVHALLQRRLAHVHNGVSAWRNGHSRLNS